MIDSEDISVVVQGPIDWTLYADTGTGTTKFLTQRLRSLLPGAEIIVSTWDDEHLDGLVSDQIVFNVDPGPQSVWPSFTPNNVNRQIASTVGGLQKTNRPYVLKIRTDMVLNDTRFLAVYDSLQPLENPDKDIFSYPIVANNISSRHTKQILNRLPDHPLLFHPSDHITFGRRDDIVMFWDVPFQSDMDAFHFIDRTYPNRWRHGELSKLSPEQHLLTSAINKKFSINMVDYGFSSPALEELSIHYMNTHFCFIPDREFSVSFPKYHNDHHFSFEWMRYPEQPDKMIFDEQLTTEPRDNDHAIDQHIGKDDRKLSRFSRSLLGRILGGRSKIR